MHGRYWLSFGGKSFAYKAVAFARMQMESHQSEGTSASTMMTLHFGTDQVYSDSLS